MNKTESRTIHPLLSDFLAKSFIYDRYERGKFDAWKKSKPQMTVAEAAKWYGLTERKVRELCRVGRMPSFRQGKSWVVFQHAPEVFLGARP